MRAKMTFIVAMGSESSYNDCTNASKSINSNYRNQNFWPVRNRVQYVLPNNRTSECGKFLSRAPPEWSIVLVTYASRFCLYQNDGRVWARGRAIFRVTLQESVRFGGGFIMIWGEICLNGGIERVIIARGTLTLYISYILEPEIQLFCVTINRSIGTTGSQSRRWLLARQPIKNVY